MMPSISKWIHHHFCCNKLLSMGPFTKYVNHLVGGRLIKKISKCDIGGRGYESKSRVTPSIKYCLNNPITMTKSWMTLLHLLSNVAFPVDNQFGVDNMHISAF